MYIVHVYMVSKDVNNINESVVPLWPNEEGIGLLHLCKNTGIVGLVIWELA